MLSSIKNSRVINFVIQSPKLRIAMGYLALSWFYAICSQIIIPLPFNLVPMSIQPAPLFLATLLFGWHAVNAYVLYLAQGALGLPFFAGMLGGLGRLMGPTGGYLIGFGVAMIFLATIRHFSARSKIIMLATLLCAEAITFVCGLSQLALFVPAHKLLAAGLFPFMVGDFLIKPILVAFFYGGFYKK